MGVKLVIPGAVFTGPVRYPHPLMNAGSLMIFDPQHSLGQFSGVPANNTPIPNVASETLAEITAASGNDLLFTIANLDTAPSAPSIKNRSGLGGLYALYSFANPATDLGSSFLGINAPQAARAHLLNTTDHAFLIAMWVRVVRKGRAGPSGGVAPQPFFWMVNNSAATSNFKFIHSGGDGAGVGELGQRVSAGLSSHSDGIVNHWNFDVGINGDWLGTKPLLANLTSPRFGLGDDGAWNGFNQPGPSGVFEFALIEDLTISGRTYAEASAAVQAEYVRRHAPGGSWFGDTFTDPATFP